MSFSRNFEAAAVIAASFASLLTMAVPVMGGENPVILAGGPTYSLSYGPSSTVIRPTIPATPSPSVSTYSTVNPAYSTQPTNGPVSAPTYSTVNPGYASSPSPYYPGTNLPTTNSGAINWNAYRNVPTTNAGTGGAEVGLTSIINDANKMGHIFRPEHNLEPLIRQLGSERAVAQEVETAAQRLVAQNGVANQVVRGVVNIAGRGVNFSGVVDAAGELSIGTFFIP